MAVKFYAVRNGIKPGIYKTWDECRAMVHGVSGAEYKSFPTLTEAQAYMERKANAQAYMGRNANVQTSMAKDENMQAGVEGKESAKSRAFSFVDGSFNAATGVYGYGGFVQYGEKREIISGCGNDAEMASMRNVAGEVLGSMAAIEKAVELGLDALDIYYDYSGIEMWAVGEWKRNKKGTIAYYEYIQSVKDKIKLNFVKVKGHSGVEGNEEADHLAKKAVGIL